VDPSYNGTVAVGNATHPFKNMGAAWAVLPKAPAKLTAGVTINLKPVSRSPSDLVEVISNSQCVTGCRALSLQGLRFAGA
jgi:hypothetical protein